jgi:hypothetical protein
MARERLLWCASLSALVTALGAFGACSSDGKPSSFVTDGGSSSQGEATGQTGGTNANQAGETSAGGSNSVGEGTGEGGASSISLPIAVFPDQIEADVGCNMVTPDASLLIRNAGDETLVISSASADSGYVVQTKLPLEIAPETSAALLIAPPAPGANADAGSMTSGKLSFTTNEPGMPSHDVTLTTTDFAGSFEFTDSNGLPVDSVALSYGSSADCPDPAKYRIHNTGNVTFTVLGPTFPAHFGGTTLGTSGQAIPPDGFAELMVGADSAPDATCSSAGGLSFTVTGPFCGTVPTLTVTWPISSDPDASSGCACTASF